MKPLRGMCRFLWQQRWIDLRWKKSLYRYLSKQGEVNDAPFVTNFFGLRYEGNLNSEIEFAIFYYGAYEKPILFFLRDAAEAMSTGGKPIDCFCDIGSNVGQHSLFMSRYAWEVHAFEPFEPVRRQLEKHLALNGIGNVTVHPLGLGSQSEVKTFFAPTGSNQGIGSFDPDSRHRGTRDIGQLQVVNGDDYLASVGITGVQLIKMDTEGFEKPVLHGLRKTMNKHRPLLVCEITYGESLSFQSLQEFRDALPEDYRFFHFYKRDAAGIVDKRLGSKSKRTGAYQLVPLRYWRSNEQDDIVAIPMEKLDYIPLEMRLT